MDFWKFSPIKNEIKIKEAQLKPFALLTILI
jgi:hypothetical protein